MNFLNFEEWVWICFKSIWLIFFFFVGFSVFKSLFLLKILFIVLEFKIFMIVFLNAFMFKRLFILVGLSNEFKVLDLKFLGIMLVKFLGIVLLFKFFL